MTGSADGPVPFHYPAPDYADAAARGGGADEQRHAATASLLEGVRTPRRGVTLFLVQLLAQCVPALRASAADRRTRSTTPARRSLIIIMLSGLFVGMVLGLQGYDLLQRFGSEEALGIAAALGLLKELGPVVTALLFAGRAGTALTSEIGLMRATDQLTAMEIMAVDPLRYVVAPRFLGGVIAMPLLAAIFSVIGLFGAQLIGVQLMGVDRGAFWSQMQGAVGLRDVMRRAGQEPGVRRRLQPDRGVRGLPRRADRRGRGTCDHAHGRGLVGARRCCSTTC